MGVGMVTMGMVAAFGLDKLLESVGITRPSLALKWKAMQTLEHTEAATAVLGPRVMSVSSAMVEKQMLVRRRNATDGKVEYLQRIKFSVVGTLGQGHAFAEGDAEGNVRFLALELQPDEEEGEATGEAQCVGDGGVGDVSGAVIAGAERVVRLGDRGGDGGGGGVVGDGGGGSGDPKLLIVFGTLEPAEKAS
jgi:hypothetical protein